MPEKAEVAKKDLAKEEDKDASGTDSDSEDESIPELGKRIMLDMLSAAEGQRPNYSSCCCCWIFRLIYALSTPTTVLPPNFFKYLKLSPYLSLKFITLSIFHYLSIYHYLHILILAKRTYYDRLDSAKQ